METKRPTSSQYIHQRHTSPTLGMMVRVGHQLELVQEIIQPVLWPFLQQEVNVLFQQDKWLSKRYVLAYRLYKSLPYSLTSTISRLVPY